MRRALNAPEDDRPLPHDLDAERAVLGAILVDNTTARAAREILTPDDFYRDAHRLVFRAELEVLDSGDTADLVTVKGRLSDLGELEKITGGGAYVASLLDGVPKAARVESYAERVKDKAERRRIMATADQITRAALNGHSAEDIAELIARLRENSTGTRRLPAEDLADILNRPMPQTPWAVEGLLAERDIAILSGPGGVGKSWLALAGALALSMGANLFGRIAVTRAYRVAVLDLESSPWEVDQRLHRLAAGMQLDPDALRGRVRIIRQRLRLDRPEDVRRLTKSLREWGTEWLLVDSLRRAFSGNENDSADVSDLFVNALDPLRSELGCGVILTDHHRKMTGDRDLDSGEAALRGSTDKRNLADAHFAIERRQERLAFHPTKTRHSAQPEPFLLELSGLAASEAEDGPVSVAYIGALDRASDRVQDAVVALLEEAGEAGALRGEIVGRVSTYGPGYSERAIDTALGSLRGRHVVKHSKEGKQVRYTLMKFVRPQPPQTSASDPGPLS